jgi:iron complex transport system substrate-binding protein
MNDRGSVLNTARHDPQKHARDPGLARIVCLTEETTEALYRMGESDRIVGVSAFTVRPAAAKRDKPVVSQFIKAEIDAIRSLDPDIVLGFSDLQADICAELIRSGIEIHCFNQRSVAGILSMIRRLGAMIGRPEKGEALAAELEEGLDRIERAAALFPERPRVYFEEWHDPMISGIGWVAELVELAGGVDCFPEFRGAKLAAERTISDPALVLERSPDVYLASWCGRKFRPDYLEKRPGWSEAPFLREGRVFEIDSATILQPGPAALTDGVWEIHRILAGMVGAEPAPRPAPLEG